MRGFGRLARVMVACAVAAAPPAAESQERPVVVSGMREPRGLPRYLDLACAYRTGDRPAALQEILDWAWLDVEGAVKAAGRLRPEHTALPVVESAALMHVHAALLSLNARDGPRAEEHAKAALSVFQLSRRLSRGGAAVRLEARSFYAALAAGCLSFWALDLAESAAAAGLEALPADPQLLYVSACIRDSSSFRHAALRQKASAQRARDEAEALFRSALKAEPADASARLQLGRILVEKEQLGEAELLLTGVAAGSGDVSLRHLAWLFLGRLRERQGRWPDAIQAYSHAVREFPESQAARFALAWATEQLSGPAGARLLVASALAAPHTLEEGRDPWLAYPFGPRSLAVRLLDELETQLRAP